MLLLLISCVHYIQYISQWTDTCSISQSQQCSIPSTKKRIVAQAGIFLFLDIMLYTDKITIACIQITTTVNCDLNYHILFSIFVSLFYAFGCYLYRCYLLSIKSTGFLFLDFQIHIFHSHKKYKIFIYP